MTNRPWSAEVEPTEELAARLIRDQFPELSGRPVAVLGKGWDNTAFLVGDDVIFRLPRKAEAATLMATEIRVLPALARRLPIRIPAPEWIGSPDAQFPWPFAGYRRVPGRPVTEGGLDDAGRVAIAPHLARFLLELHAIDPASVDVPGDVLNRRDFRLRAPLVEERLAYLVERGIARDPAPLLALFAELADAAPIAQPALVHGDLYARHLLVSDEGRLSGVIDWGDVHAGDVAMDLMVAYGFLPARARPAFFEEYGAAGDDVLRTARLRAAFHAVSVTWYGVALHDRDLVEEGRRALRWVVRD